ncbi:ciliary microtubule associated protein 1A-like isoform X2 [Halichondria panicea]|uniref:ciliary microtubule associated protein 1A-like isoform X2 n=1 Tax=Halichondria panicea TaxID=6063 RepID=UPI00312BC1E5
MVRSSPPNTVKIINVTPERKRPKIAAMENGPGPAKYLLRGSTGHNDHITSKRRLPAYSFGVKTKQFSTMSTNSFSPGPVYFVSSSVSRTGTEGTPKYSLLSRAKSHDKRCSPGPAAYHTEKVSPLKQSRPPHYSFGLKPELPLWKSSGNNPSPSTYTLPSLVGSSIVSKRSTPAYSMTGRSKIGSFHEDTKKTPGPGAYSVVNSQVYGHKSPSYSLHDRCSLPGDHSMKPGPGAHSPEKNECYKKNPAYSFGIKHSEYLANFLEIVT